MGDEPSSKSHATSPEDPSLRDRELDPSRSSLLDLAMDAASAMPALHGKDRSRSQEEVVDLCLELDLPERALRYAERIDNWRRGTAFADIASWYAEHGDADRARPLIGRARKVAQSNAGEDDQEWRVDRIKVAMAAAHVLLGEMEPAAELERVLVESEMGKVNSVRARVLEGVSLDAVIADLERLALAGAFEPLVNALRSANQVLRRVYEDEASRDRLETAMRATWVKIPLGIRIDLLVEMSDIALEKGDQEHAVALARETRKVRDESHWLPENLVPMMAKLALQRHRVGETEEAAADLDTALVLFAEARDSLPDLRRARMLRPVAEAYQELGRESESLALFATAVQEGAENANARPRAMDLAATCASMARVGVSPDAALWTQLRTVYEGLGDPW